MKWYSILILPVLAVACTQDPTVPANLPDAPTVSIDERSLSRASMLVTGSFGNDLTDITSYGVEISETLFEEGATYSALVPQEVNEDGSFSLGVTGLKANQTYFVRCFVSNGHSKLYSKIFTEQTPETSVASVSDVTLNGEFLTATIEDDGGRVLEEVGFVWGDTNERRSLRREKRHMATLEPDGKTFTLPVSHLGVGTFYVLAYVEDEKDGTGFSRISFERKVNEEDITEPHGSHEGTSEENWSFFDYTPLKLNEINGNDKFIEIVNTGSKDIDMKGVYFQKDGATRWTGLEGTVLKAGKFLLLYSFDVTVTGAAQEGYASELVFDSGLSAKKPMHIELFDPDGNSLDDFNLVTLLKIQAPASYGVNAAGGWYYQDATPGAVNVDGTDVVFE